MLQARRGSDASRIPPGADMLYSLAAAASTHRGPNGLPVNHEAISPTGPNGGPSGGNPYPPNLNAEGGAQANWNNYHEEIGTLFKDDFSNQMEYAAEGWAI